MYEGGRNDEEMLYASQDVYELSTAEHGEAHEFTIDAGRIYAVQLQRSNRGDEARTLLTKLLATSKQVLSSHHSTTKEVDYALTGANRLFESGSSSSSDDSDDPEENTTS